MKQFSLIAALICAFPAAGSALDVDKYVEAILGPRLRVCTKHFDVVPFAYAAFEKIPSEAENALKSYEQTGRLTLQEQESKDPIAVQCASFAEGLLSKKFSSQKSLQSRVQTCKESFDIEPYIVVAANVWPLEEIENELIDKDVIQAMDRFELAGRLMDSASMEQESALALSCSSFAEGVLAVQGFQLVEKFNAALYEAVGGVSSKTFRSALDDLYGN